MLLITVKNLIFLVINDLGARTSYNTSKLFLLVLSYGHVLGSVRYNEESVRDKSARFKGSTNKRH